MTALVRPKTSDAVAEHVLGLLFEGRVRTGDRIDLDLLAAELGVSRAPVREALILLERDGLVEMPPYRGAFVADFNAATVREAFDLYGMLCALTSQRVSVAGDPVVLARLREVFLEIAGAGTVLDFERAAREFRRIVNTSASGPHLRVLFRTFGGLVPAAARLSIERDMEAERAALGHELETLLARDPQAAAGAAVEHIEGTASAAIAALEERGVFAADGRTPVTAGAAASGAGGLVARSGAAGDAS